MDQTRFFRTYAQWASRFMRFAGTAVAMKLWTWDAVVCHMDVVAQLVEKERLANKLPYVAFAYEDQLRQQLAAQAMRTDPSFDVMATVKSINKDLLDLVSHRLQGVLEAANLIERKYSQAPPSQAAMGTADAAQGAAEKTLQAATRIQQQTQEAARKLAHQQSEMLRRAEAMQLPTSEPGASSKKGEQREKWRQKQDARRDAQNAKKQKGKDT